MQEETPFEQLKSLELTDFFNRIVSSEFEMAVVATMSSGKSTLLNAILGRELLPARNEACTATLARIHDIDSKSQFSGKGYDNNGNEFAFYNPLDLSGMNELNENPNTAFIEIYGNIPGIDNDALRLVLTDTPGPNNNRTYNHKEHLYSLLNADYKPMILYVLNGTQLESNDDALLLADVAKAMNEGGRQAHERVIFILNKADEFDPAKGETIERKMQDIHVYLEKYGIHNARVFPAAARMAKVIRQFQNNQPLTEMEEDEILPKYQSFIKRDWKHFSDFAPLSTAGKKKQDEQIAVAKSKNNQYEEALWYTGIPSIELAINEYLSKYALPAKITDGIVSFKNKIDGYAIESQTIENIKKSNEKIQKLLIELNQVEQKLENSKKSLGLSEKIDGFSFMEYVKQAVVPQKEDLLADFSVLTKEMNKNDMPKAESDKNLEEIQKWFFERVRNFQLDMQASLNAALKNAIEESVREYQCYLADVMSDSSYTFIPAGILGEMPNISVLSVLDSYTKTEIEENKMKDVAAVGVGVLTIAAGIAAKLLCPALPTPALAFGGQQLAKNISDEIDSTKVVETVDFAQFIENDARPKLNEIITETEKVVFDTAQSEEKKFKEFFKKVVSELNAGIEQKIAQRKKILANKAEFEKFSQENERNRLWLQKFMQAYNSLLFIEPLK